MSHHKPSSVNKEPQLPGDNDAQLHELHLPQVPDQIKYHCQGKQVSFCRLETASDTPENKTENVTFTGPQGSKKNHDKHECCEW